MQMASQRGAFSGDAQGAIVRRKRGRTLRRRVTERVDGQRECDKPTDCASVLNTNSPGDCSGTHHLCNITNYSTSRAVRQN